MRTLVAMLFSVILLAGAVFAAAGDAAQGSLVPSATAGAGSQAAQSGAGASLDKMPNGTASQVKSEIQTRTQVRQEAMESEMQGMNKDQQAVYKNQNTVRLAVHALLDMEGVSGGIGKNVSAIAREFNNSVQSTIRAEEKIMKKGGFARFFSGGDEETGKELEAEVSKNQERLQKLNQLKNQANVSQEVKTMLQEQITLMEQEQTRLKTLAQKEQKSKGMLGWIWK